MDKRIDLTINRDFSERKDRSRLTIDRLIPTLTENEIATGFPTGTMDEIKVKIRMLNIHHKTEGDKPSCLRCGTQLIYTDSMTCNKCDEDFTIEALYNNIEYLFINKYKNTDKESDVIRELFQIKN